MKIENKSKTLNPSMTGAQESALWTVLSDNSQEVINGGVVELNPSGGSRRTGGR